MWCQHNVLVDCRIALGKPTGECSDSAGPPAKPSSQSGHLKAVISKLSSQSCHPKAVMGPRPPAPTLPPP